MPYISWCWQTQAHKPFHRTTDCFDWTWVGRPVPVSFQPHVNVCSDEKTPAQRGDSSMLQISQYIITSTCKCASGIRPGYFSNKRKRGISMPESLNSTLRFRLTARLTGVSN